MVLSLQLAHRLEDTNVLLVGGGEVALTRINKLIPTSCRVTVIAPDIHPTIIEKYGNFNNDTTNKDIINGNWEQTRGRQIYRIINDKFNNSHLSLYKDENSPDSGWSLIMTCIPDPELSKHIYEESKKLFGSQQLVNVADNPPLCDFYFGANLELGQGEKDKGEALLQLMISSNGASPRFSALVRNEIGSIFEGVDLRTSVLKLGDLRKRIRERANKPEDLKYRMQWIRECTDIYGIKYCHLIDIENLLKLYDSMYADNKSLTFPTKEEMLRSYVE